MQGKSSPIPFFPGLTLFLRSRCIRDTSSTQHHDNDVAIVGGLLGTVLGLLLVFGLVIFLVRQTRKSSPHHDGVSPFKSDDSSLHANALLRPHQVSEKRAAALPAQISQPHPTGTTSPSQSGIGVDAEGGATTSREAIGSGLALLPNSGVVTGLAPSSGAQPVLVDRIIELIADRIDRRDAGYQAADADEPPRYPDSVV